jgi:N-methylhydantoinase A/oxoprolinase/acetone carboxylase beta subunit
MKISREQMIDQFSKAGYDMVRKHKYLPYQLRGSMASAESYWSALDAGGTMTDSVIVDPNGRYLPRKALTNKRDESLSFLAAMRDATSLGGRRLEEVLPHTRSIVYAGTILLNTILSRTGAAVGLMLTQGLEDYLLMEKGEGSWLGYSYSDRLHTVTHSHAEPLIPRRRVVGVQGRVDIFGQEVTPLRAEEVRRQARELVEQGADVIALVFMFSHLNPAHEQAAAAAIHEVYPQIPVVLSSQMAPTHKEYSRLASVVAQAYAGERARGPGLPRLRLYATCSWRHRTHQLPAALRVLRLRAHRRPVGGVLCW